MFDLVKNEKYRRQDVWRLVKDNDEKEKYNRDDDKKEYHETDEAPSVTTPRCRAWNLLRPLPSSPKLMEINEQVTKR